METGEHELPLGLDPRNAEQRERCRGVRRVVEQRRLTHSRLAVDDQGSALTLASCGQQAVEDGAFISPVEELSSGHRSTG